MKCITSNRRLMLIKLNNTSQKYTFFLRNLQQFKIIKIWESETFLERFNLKTKFSLYYSKK
jgi:hypothetical protein